MGNCQCTEKAENAVLVEILSFTEYTATVTCVLSSEFIYFLTSELSQCVSYELITKAISCPGLYVLP